MYCLGCQYDLRGLPERRCPECGRAFDPQDPATYLKVPTQPRPYFLLVLIWLVPILLFAMLLLTLGVGRGLPIRELLWGLGVALCGLLNVVLPIAVAPYVGPFVLLGWLALLHTRKVRLRPIWPWALFTWLWHIMGCAPTGFGSV